MADFRQKQDSAGRDFRRGLEELVRGHIDGCMTTSLASCSSSAAATEDDDDYVAAAGDGADQLARRRRRSVVAGEDLAETSAAARRHSRILSRWVARQAEEMMTTMERRNRESELMALARLHTVSMLDASFLRESRRSHTTVERPAVARASSVLQRWRELEGSSAAARELESRRPLFPASVSDISRNGGESRSSPERADGSELTSSEIDGNDYRQEGNEPSEAAIMAQGMETEDTSDRESTREQSPDLGEGWDGERERVRQIVRSWMMGTAIEADTALRTSSRSETPRGDLLGEIERERVRLARERVRLVSQQRHAQASRTEPENAHFATERVDPPEQVRRDQPRLRGRQARLDLIMRMVRERERELQGLSEHRSVSSFAYRNRIQALLRGRFLRNIGRSEGEYSSVGVRELGQLRQHRPVSGLMEGFHSQPGSGISDQASNQSTMGSLNVNNLRNATSSSVGELSSNAHDQYQIVNQIVNEIAETYEEAETLVTVDMENSMDSENAEWMENTTHGENWQDDAEDGEEEWRQSIEDSISEGSEDEYYGNWQENIDDTNPHETPEGNMDSNSYQETPEYWQEEGSQDVAPIWEGESLASLQRQQPFNVRRTDRFIVPDDDNVYSLELRELLRRRSVSNLLSSGFRESLDQLIESYARRQESNLFDWDLQRMDSTADSQEVDHSEQRDELIQDEQISFDETPPMLSSPPVPPPPPPLWHANLHRTNWAAPHNIHRSERDVINDLKAEMVRLQEGMNHMQRTLEACMDMQLELQRSVRQEVSTALNRAAGGRGQGLQAEMTDTIRNSNCEDFMSQLVQAATSRAPRAKLAQFLTETIARGRLGLADHNRIGTFSDYLDHSWDKQNYKVTSIYSLGDEEVCSHDISRWSQVNKGTCCICCDNHIDALLYRCGHMCTCSKCASELVRAEGRCPLCRAPILEVIRAYSIM